MIDSGTTQVEVRVEGRSRTIIIHVNHDLLKDTKDMVNALSPHYSEAEHKTFQGLRDSTLLKSIGDLALRVSSLFSFSFLCFSLLLSLILTFLWFADHHLGDRECSEREKTKGHLPEIAD